MFRKKRALIVKYKSGNMDYFRSIVSSKSNYAEMYEDIVNEIENEKEDGQLFRGNYVITDVIKL